LEIGELLQKGAIVCVQDVPDQYISTIFLVPKKDGSQRPVINLKQLNKYIHYHHFKMEGVHMVKDLLQEGDFLCKLDLRDAYFCVPVNSRDRKFLRFRWGTKLYEFTCMAFGLAPGPRKFTKLLKPVVGLLRRLGIRLIIYLDDMLIMAASRQELIKHRDTVLYLLQVLGLVINGKKSQLIPTQEIEFLGFCINSITMMFLLPKTKMENILQICSQMITQDQITVRQLAMVTGKMVATMQAILPATLQCRQLQMAQIQALMLGKNYDDLVGLSHAIKADLRWWIDHLHDCNGRAIITPSPDFVIESDACDTGWGGACDTDRTGGPWSETEFKYHINAKELLAAFLSLQAFAKHKTRIAIHIKVDNMTALAYLLRMGGTKSALMNQITRDIWDWCSTRDITLSAEHIPGVDNMAADWESRHVTDASDWQLNQDIFRQLQARLGTADVDLFASRLNHQIHRYVSWRSDPLAWATDAFQIRWTELNAYLFPPFSLIGRCLAKIRKDKATVTIVAPIWQAQPWYPLLLTMAVHNPIKLPPSHDLLRSPQGEIHPLVVAKSLHMAAWRVSGNVQKLKRYQDDHDQYSHMHGDQVPEQLIKAPGMCGIAGVGTHRVIPFEHLWSL
jgi:hypothetical protein